MRGTSTGGSYATAEDLSHFAKALQAHKLLNAALTDLVTTGKVRRRTGKSMPTDFEIEPKMAFAGSAIAAEVLERIQLFGYILSLAPLNRTNPACWFLKIEKGLTI